MNPDELENLLRELVQAVQLVMQSGEVLSDEFQGIIAQTLGNLVNRIEEAEQPHENEPINANPSNDAELLWILSGQQPQAFISYLRTFPTQSTRELLNNPQLLNATIERLNQTMPAGQPASIGGIQHSDLNSSNIWGTAYDQRTGKMKVRFQGGSEYEYEGVPQNIYNAFSKGNASATTRGRNQYGRWWPNKNPSLGAAMNQYIKAGGFNYRKIR